ncbi:hypothetical protein JHK82_012203 [Glycine max]|nr:hypothetical protein JHK85_012540 [Glycine max]KAG5057211.1 hypothetical protein JHK86_012207 [Glycine max]KAG5154234.1 hypothetical protein JHK82_012203 [Glycine max]
MKHHHCFFVRKRKFLGEGLGACSIEELQWIQQQLERSLNRSSGKLSRGQLHGQTSEDKLSKGDSDDEMLSSVLKFKDHRRCSYMIANALDKDGKFTTAQVSRKLKQLGLYLPLPKDGKFTSAQGW